MTIRYSKSKNNFYPLGLNYAAADLPADLIEVSDADHRAALSRPKDYTFDFVGGVLVITPPAPPTLAQNQSDAIAKIDSDVDAIYQKKIGNRQSEYSLAESDANSYKTAAYPASPVPASVQAWATAKGWTPKQAADDIILTASNWRTAQADIRTNRLAKKEVVRAATTQAAIDTAMAAWATFVSTTRTNLGI
jgi:hypothetical protein